MLVDFEALAESHDEDELAIEEDGIDKSGVCQESTKREGGDHSPVSYTHLTLPTTPYV